MRAISACSPLLCAVIPASAGFSERMGKSGQDGGCIVRDQTAAIVGVDFSHTIEVAGADIQFSEAVKLLGVTLDTFLSFDQHVTNVVRACNFHLRSLRHL